MEKEPRREIIDKGTIRRSNEIYFDYRIFIEHNDDLTNPAIRAMIVGYPMMCGFDTQVGFLKPPELPINTDTSNSVIIGIRSSMDSINDGEELTMVRKSIFYPLEEFDKDKLQHTLLNLVLGHFKILNWCMDTGVPMNSDPTYGLMEQLLPVYVSLTKTIVEEIERREVNDK